MPQAKHRSEILHSLQSCTIFLCLVRVFSVHADRSAFLEMTGTDVKMCIVIISWPSNSNATLFKEEIASIFLSFLYFLEVDTNCPWQWLQFCAEFFGTFLFFGYFWVIVSTATKKEKTVSRNNKVTFLSVWYCVTVELWRCTNMRPVVIGVVVSVTIILIDGHWKWKLWSSNFLIDVMMINFSGFQEEIYVFMCV